MTQQYEFKKGSYLSGDAQAVGEKLEAIRQQDGCITPDAVVIEAKPKDSVLHPYFEWSDKKAAHEYRCNQARHITRNTVVVTYNTKTEKKETHRAFTQLGKTVVEQPGYYETLETMSDDTRKIYVLNKIRDQLMGFHKKMTEYRSYDLVLPVLEAIETSLETLVTREKAS